MTPFRLTSLIFLFSISACVRVQAETPWIDADSLRETVGLGNEWDEWQPEEIEGWKYIENFGAFFPGLIGSTILTMDGFTPLQRI